MPRVVSDRVNPLSCHPHYLPELSMKLIRLITAILLVAGAEIATANCNGEPSGLATCGSAPCPKGGGLFQNGGCHPG